MNPQVFGKDPETEDRGDVTNDCLEKHLCPQKFSRKDIRQDPEIGADQHALGFPAEIAGIEGHNEDQVEGEWKRKKAEKMGLNRNCQSQKKNLQQRFHSCPLFNS